MSKKKTKKPKIEIDYETPMKLSYEDLRLEEMEVGGHIFIPIGHFAKNTLTSYISRKDKIGEKKFRLRTRKSKKTGKADGYDIWRKE